MHTTTPAGKPQIMGVVGSLLMMTTPLFSASWETQVPLNHKIFGVAIATTVVSRNGGAPETDPYLTSLINEMNPGIVRVPGGDAMNEWSWSADQTEGSSYTTPERNWQQLADGNSATRREVVWGVNARDGYYGANTHNALRYAITNNNLSSTYFELGNELYYQHWGYFNGTTADVLRYTQEFNPDRLALRDGLPGPQYFGVPCASYHNLYKHNPFRIKTSKTEVTNYDNWYNRLAGNYPSLFDAMVLHLYVTPEELARKQNGTGNLTVFSANDAARWAWCRADKSQVSAVFELAKSFAPGKKIWVTEWGFNPNQYMNNPNIALDDRKKCQVHQTLMQGMHNLRFMLNTACYYGDVVEIMTLWTLYQQPSCATMKADNSKGFNYEIMRLLAAARQRIPGGQDGKIARLNYTPGSTYLWDGPAYVPSGYVDQDFDNAIQNSPILELFGFFDNSGNLKAIIGFNLHTSDFSVAVTDLPSSFAYGYRLTDTDLLPLWNADGNPAPSQWFRTPTTSTYSNSDKAAVGQIRLKAKSVCLVLDSNVSISGY